MFRQMIFVFLLLFLAVSSAMKITDIQMDDEINIHTGSRLIIPCSFHVSGPIESRDITLEWDKTEEGGMYTRLIYLTVSKTTVLLREKLHDTRVQLFISRVHHGNCSLAIDSVSEDDSGIYELHLKINGFTNNHIPKVRINIYDQTEETGISPIEMDNLRFLVNNETDGNAQDSLDQEDSTDAATGTSQPDAATGTSQPDAATGTSQPDAATGTSQTVIEEEIQHEMANNGMISPLDTQNHQGSGLYFDMLLQSLVKKGLISYFAIPVVIGLVVVILACIGGCYLGIRWYNCCIKPENQYKAMEEGRLVTNQSENQNNPRGSEETTISMSTDLSSIPPERTTVLNMPTLSTDSESCPSYTVTMTLEEDGHPAQQTDMLPNVHVVAGQGAVCGDRAVNSME